MEDSMASGHHCEFLLKRQHIAFPIINHPESFRDRQLTLQRYRNNDRNMATSVLILEDTIWVVLCIRLMLM